MFNQIAKLAVPNKWLVSLGAFFSTMFGAITPIMVTIGILLILDFLTGITKAIVKKDIESRVMKKGIVKIGTYAVILIIGHRLSLLKENEIVGIITEFIANGMYLMIVLTESISCLENVEEVCEKYKIDIPVIRVLAKILKKKVEKIGAKKYL